MLSNLTNSQINNFLLDSEKNTDIEIFDSSKKTSDILEIAKARGIDLKNNRDLSGFRTVYTMPDITDRNGQILPKKILLKAMPTLIGKPININHERNYVIGTFLNYAYNAKENKVITYGVFFRSNFSDEWEEAKKLFKAGKLKMSSEIWCPKEKRRYFKDGSFELLEMELAGAGLLYDVEPAVEGADVLALAKKRMNNNSDADLVYSSKYEKDELLICNGKECELKCSEDRGKGQGVDKKKVGDGGATVCKCTTCNYTIEHEKGKPCNEINCPKCKTALVGSNDKEEPKEEVKVEGSKTKCANCGEELDYAKLPETSMGACKCPKCFAIIDQTGKMLYPPQIIDFNVSCLNPACGVKNWLILNKSDKGAKIRCMSCSKEYEIKFKKNETDNRLAKLMFVYSKVENCKQCNTSIQVSGVSNANTHTKAIKCSKCGLEFNIEIDKSSEKKVIKSIKEITNSKKTEEKKMKVEDKKEKKVEKEIVEESKKLKKSSEEVKEEPRVEVKKEDVKVEEKKEDVKVEKKVEVKKEDVKVEEKPKEDKVEGKVEEAKVDSFKPLYRDRVKKLIQVVRDTRKELDTLKSDFDGKVDFYKTNAKTLLSRRNELGENGKELTDEQVMDEKDFKIAKYEKELEIKKNADVKKEEDKANLSVASKEVTTEDKKTDDYYTAKAKEVAAKAFPEEE